MLRSNQQRRGAIEKSSESRAERVRLLSMVDVLEPLMSEQTDLLVQRTQERAFGRGESVYALGDASEAVFLLLTGRIRLYGMVGGQELTFEVVRAGTMFGISVVDGAHPRRVRPGAGTVAGGGARPKRLLASGEAKPGSEREVVESAG